MKQRYNLRVISYIFAILSFVSIFTTNTDDIFNYKRTRDNHCKYIGNVIDLLEFANEVNTGITYEGQVVLQTNDIDLSGVEWPSIGVFGSDYYFLGTYDGDGHIIKNLNVNTSGNNSLFGQLGGTVMNLGIESGYISGACLGGITSHSSNSDAVIINCYNKATVQGTRSGGIADNFNGTIYNCWTECELISSSPEYIGGIISYDASYVGNCFSIEEYGRSTVNKDGIEIANKESVNYNELVEKLNRGIYLSSSNTGIKHNSLHLWTVSDNAGNIVFSKEKASFEMKYGKDYIVNYIIQIMPCVVIAVLFGICIIVIRKTS